MNHLSPALWGSATPHPINLGFYASHNSKQANYRLSQNVIDPSCQDHRGRKEPDNSFKSVNEHTQHTQTHQNTNHKSKQFIHRSCWQLPPLIFCLLIALVPCYYHYYKSDVFKVKWRLLPSRARAMSTGNNTNVDTTTPAVRLINMISMIHLNMIAQVVTHSQMTENLDIYRLAMRTTIT